MMSYQQIQGSGSGFQFLNKPFGNATYTKVFVGGLAWETQSETLRRHFEQYGEILEAVVITEKHTGRSKGYGFVTFRDPASARKACADPNPIIDGRRANCNLAALGRPQLSFPYGLVRPAMPYFGLPHMPRGAYVRSPSFQPPGHSIYQPGIAYPPYGYMAYGPEFVYPQGVYNPYVGQHYLQLYGLAGPDSTNIGPYGQLDPPLPGTTVQGFVTPTHPVPQFGGRSVSGLTTETITAMQTGLSARAPGLPCILLPAHPSQFTQSSSSDLTAS